MSQQQQPVELTGENALTALETEKLMRRVEHEAGCFSESPGRPCDCGTAVILVKLHAALSQTTTRKEQG